MSDFLLNKDSIIIDLSADSSIDVSGHALVFNRGALGVDNDDFDEKFSLAKTLTSILDSSGATTNNSNTQLLNSLLDTFNISSEAKISKHNINSKAVLQKRQRREEREERVYLSATRYSPQCSPLLALRSKRLNIAVGDMSER
jgi:uncharacterized protein YxjI